MDEIDFKNLRYVLIDFDGTLVDSIPILYDNYMQFLKKYHRQGTRDEFNSLMGPTIKEFIPILADLHQLKTDQEILLKDYLEGLSDRYAQEVKMMRGAKEFLDYIHQKKLKSILVTSSPIDLIEKSLDALHLKRSFDFLITGDRVKKTKPSPEIYLYALEQARIQAPEALAIEDSDNGILSALNAGISTILIHREFESPPLKNTMVIRNWYDLLKLFKKYYEK